MNKNQFKLFYEILNRFDEEGVLDNIILIGSWCVPLYKEYFFQNSQVSPIRTTDVDFLVPLPLKDKAPVDVPSLLFDLGFVVDFVGEQGYMRLNHPDLNIEFLVHEKGRGEEKPVDLRKFHVNAQALRFLNVLQEKTIKIKVNDKVVRIPHPAWFAVHKLIVTQRRTKKDKAEKDFKMAIDLLHDLIAVRKKAEIRAAFNFVSKKWQKKIGDLLRDVKEEEILNIIYATKQ